jgi:Icc protein
MFNIIQISDTHLLEDSQQISKGRFPHAQLVRALLHINQHINGEKILIVTGDLVSDVTPNTYKILSTIFNQFAGQVYIIPGNHDDSNYIKQYIVGENINHSGYLQFANWKLILLDSSMPGIKLGSGKLSVAELQRLETLLNQKPVVNTLIFMHHPPILFGAKWFQEIYLENRDEFHAIIKYRKEVKAIIFGHAHTQWSNIVDGIQYICCPSTWRQIDHSNDEKAVYNDLPGGYNCYQLGEDGTFQFESYYF